MEKKYYAKIGTSYTAILLWDHLLGQSSNMHDTSFRLAI